MTERWRPAPGFPDYEVSSHGQCRRVTAARGTQIGRFLTPVPTTKGYLKVRFQVDGRQRNVRLHKLIAEAFLTPRPAGHQPDHIDGDKRNNRADNLEWVTSKENHRRAIAMGLRNPRHTANRRRRSA